MRKNCTTFALLLIICSSLCIATACKRTGGNNTKLETALPLEFDSAIISLNDEHTEFSAQLTAPKDTTSAFALAVWKEIFSMCRTNMELPDTALMKNYRISKFGETIGKAFIRESEEEIKDIMESLGKDAAENLNYSNKFSVATAANTRNYVTLEYKGYLYTGGAHGMPAWYATSIDAKSCKALGIDDLFVKEHQDSLFKIVKEEILKQYYKEEQAHESFSMTALPANAPHLMPDGIRFIYGAYEVDAYAAGMPFCILPYEQVLHLMTEEAQSLIK